MTKRSTQSNKEPKWVWENGSPQENKLEKSHIFSSIFNNNANTKDPSKAQESIQQIRQSYLAQLQQFSYCILCGLLGGLIAGIGLTIALLFWLGSTSSNSTSSATSYAGSGSGSGSNNAQNCETWVWETNGTTVAGDTGGVAGSASNQLKSPWNIYIDPISGSLYIADSLNHRIQLWFPGATSGITVAGNGVAGSSTSSLNTPKDVYVDSSQNIYIADSLNQRIQFFVSGSTSGITMSSNWSSPGELWGVQLVSGSIYACDKSKSGIWNNGSIVAGNLLAGGSPNQFNQPQGFAIDTSNSVGTAYVANSLQHTIVQWPVGASQGTIVAGVNGILGNNSTLLNIPVAIKLDSDNNMFVVDNNNHRIQLFCQSSLPNTKGRTIAGITGVMGTTSQTLNYPAGVALDSSRNLYVSDTSNHRVQKFRRIV